MFLIIVYICIVIEIRAEIQSSGFDSGKKVKIIHEDQGNSCALSWEKSDKLRGKNQKFCLNPVKVIKVDGFFAPI